MRKVAAGLFVSVDGVVESHDEDAVHPQLPGGQL